MDATQKGIITLLKSAITEQALPLPEDFALESAYRQIKRHHLAALACEGAVRCGVPPENPAMQKLLQGYGKCLLISERQMAEIRRVCSVFDENAIDYMMLKGCKMKALYPKPELRMMGDADILIRLEQYPKIIPLMESLGFTADADSNHELVWKIDGLYLELHKRLIPSYNKDFYAYFGDGWRLAAREEGTRYSMTAEDEMVYLFTHFAKHFRDGGIGCRHVVDLWVYRRAHPQLDEAYVKGELKNLQLLEFYQNILDLLAVWFEDAPADDKMEFISEFIFSSGSWGEDKSRMLSRTVRDSKHSVLGFSGRLVYLWKTVFCSVEALREKYTILKTAPYLLPVVWVVRPFYKILFEWNTLNRQKDKLKALKQDNLETRQKMLNYVGLDYNF